jgi:hypothetical protein
LWCGPQLGKPRVTTIATQSVSPGCPPKPKYSEPPWWLWWSVALLVWIVLLCIMLCCRGKVKKKIAKRKSKRMEKKIGRLGLYGEEDEDEPQPTKKKRKKRAVSDTVGNAEPVAEPDRF